MNVCPEPILVLRLSGKMSLLTPLSMPSLVYSVPFRPTISHVKLDRCKHVGIARMEEKENMGNIDFDEDDEDLLLEGARTVAFVWRGEIGQEIPLLEQERLWNRVTLSKIEKRLNRVKGKTWLSTGLLRNKLDQRQLRSTFLTWWWLNGSRFGYTRDCLKLAFDEIKSEKNSEMLNHPHAWQWFTQASRIC